MTNNDLGRGVNKMHNTIDYPHIKQLGIANAIKILFSLSYENVSLDNYYIERLLKAFIRF